MERDLAKELILYRAKRKISQKQLAKELNVSTMTILRAESGSCGKVTRALLEDLLDKEKEV